MTKIKGKNVLIPDAPPVIRTFFPLIFVMFVDFFVVLFYCSYGNNCAKSAAKVMHNFRTIVRFFDKKFVSMIFF